MQSQGTESGASNQSLSQPHNTFYVQALHASAGDNAESVAEPLESPRISRTDFFTLAQWVFQQCAKDAHGNASQSKVMAALKQQMQQVPVSISTKSLLCARCSAFQNLHMIMLLTVCFLVQEPLGDQAYWRRRQHSVDAFQTGIATFQWSHAHSRQAVMHIKCATCKMSMCKLHLLVPCLPHHMLCHKDVDQVHNRPAWP